MKYRVLAEYLTDGHFIPEKPRVLLKSDDIDECYDFVEKFYKEHFDAWIELHVQEYRTTTISRYEDV